MVAFGIGMRGYVWLYDMAPVREQAGPAFGLHFVEGIYYPTWARLDGLLDGVALAALGVGRPQVWSCWQARRGSLFAAGAGLFGLALWLFRDRLGFWPSVIGYPLLSLGLALWVMLATGLPASWKLPGAGWLARISYSVYLSHKLALHAVAMWLVQPWQLHGLAAFALYAVGVLAVGAVLHYTVEQPFLRWRERIDKRQAMLFVSAAVAS